MGHHCSLISMLPPVTLLKHVSVRLPAFHVRNALVGAPAVLEWAPVPTPLRPSLCVFLGARPCSLAFSSISQRPCFISTLVSLPFTWKETLFFPQIVTISFNWLCFISGPTLSTYPLTGWWPRLWRICLQCRRPGFDPWIRKTPWRRKWQPTPVFLPGELHRERSLAVCSPWGHKESDTTERLTLSLSHRLK